MGASSLQNRFLTRATPVTGILTRATEQIEILTLAQDMYGTLTRATANVGNTYKRNRHGCEPLRVQQRSLGPRAHATQMFGSPYTCNRNPMPHSSGEPHASATVSQP